MLKWRTKKFKQCFSGIASTFKHTSRQPTSHWWVVQITWITSFRKTNQPFTFKELSGFPMSGSCTFSKLLISVLPTRCLNNFCAFHPLDLFYAGLCLPVPNICVIISTMAYPLNLNSSLKHFTTMDLSRENCLLLCCLFHLSQTTSSPRFEHICFTSPLFDVTSQPFLLFSFLLSCFILSVHLIYAVSSTSQRYLAQFSS